MDRLRNLGGTFRNALRRMALSMTSCPCQGTMGWIARFVPFLFCRRRYQYEPQNRQTQVCVIRNLEDVEDWNIDLSMLEAAAPKPDTVEDDNLVNSLVSIGPVKPPVFDWV